ncbi:hypothetical protein KPH14_007096 [Odynerus spinipes]|uniref:non-specific serine/threonine protein kinase n=1 Tax=Odynerus spinipes TaxID=1348599 RepID=A0AAD9RRU3_9HYME|nr:hypothetical protein KPH14_007096 [Odynerus spinipes]
MELRVGNKYRLGRKIGSGSFGDIYLGTNISTGEEVAIKLECIKTRHPQLHIESKFYKMMQGGVGIPTIKWCGSEGDYNVMVMELLGPSLEDLFNFCSRRFSLKTVLLLADQLISRTDYIHSRNFIHRDIKPDNFLMGLGKKGNLVYIIDFGLAKKYRDGRTHKHILYRENKNLTGTARYASINTHLGIEQSRRDDLESLGYVLMYFNRGSLPWQGLKAATKRQKYERISEKKMSTPIEELCKGYPVEFGSYLKYCRALRFEERPDYSYLRQLFRTLFHSQGFTYDYIFDWNLLKFGNTRQPTLPSVQQAPMHSQPTNAALPSGTNNEQEHRSRPYTRQCLANASVATVGQTVATSSNLTADLRTIRQKRREALNAHGDQDNQDKSDLQGKIQFYQQFCAIQQQAAAERKSQFVVGHSQAAGNDASRVNPCQFSTFKSSPGRAAPEVASLDLVNLNLGHHELGPNQSDINSTLREYYQPVNSLRERNPSTASTHVDKQSYFFHGHKTKKDVDRQVVMFEDLETSNCISEDRRVHNTEEGAASSSSMNCFGGLDEDKKGGGKAPPGLGVKRLTMAYELRRDSENVEFLEREGEIFKKSSSEMLQETSSGRRRNFSFHNKEKTYRSLESLERSGVDLPGVDVKSLDLLPEDGPKLFFHGKQRSLDSSQKSKKSSTSSVNKARKRPNFFQRVGRSLHFLPREREKCQDLLKQEEPISECLQTDQEKCEYFLKRQQKDVAFFEDTPNPLASRAPVNSNLGFFSKRDVNPRTKTFCANASSPRADSPPLAIIKKDEPRAEVNDLKSNVDDVISAASQEDRSSDTEPTQSSRLLNPVASVTTQETLSGNKDSLEVGYSISQIGRFYLQTLQNVGRSDVLRSSEIPYINERDRYLDWLQRGADLDGLSHGTNLSDSLGHSKPQGNLDILKASGAGGQERRVSMRLHRRDAASAAGEMQSKSK